MAALSVVRFYSHLPPLGLKAHPQNRPEIHLLPAPFTVVLTSENIMLLPIADVNGLTHSFGTRLGTVRTRDYTEVT